MITYINPKTGNVASCSLASSVPEGVEYFNVQPPETKEFRDAWEIVNGEISINLVKAKEISSLNLERKNEAEAIKQVALGMNAPVKAAIDAATTIEQLKAAMP